VSRKTHFIHSSFYQTNGRILKSKLELNSNDAKIFLSVFVFFFFKLKAELEVLKFEFCQVKLMQNNG